MSISTLQLLFTVDGALKVDNVKPLRTSSLAGRPVNTGLDNKLIYQFLRGVKL